MKWMNPFTLNVNKTIREGNKQNKDVEPVLFVWHDVDGALLLLLLLLPLPSVFQLVVTLITTSRKETVPRRAATTTRIASSSVNHEQIHKLSQVQRVGNCRFRTSSSSSCCRPQRSTSTTISSHFIPFHPNPLGLSFNFNGWQINGALLSSQVISETRPKCSWNATGKPLLLKVKGAQQNGRPSIDPENNMHTSKSTCEPTTYSLSKRIITAAHGYYLHTDRNGWNKPQPSVTQRLWCQTFQRSRHWNCPSLSFNLLINAPIDGIAIDLTGQTTDS